jgi:hypothetical protein
MYRLALIVTLFFSGCSSAAEDLRPFVAVAGRYSLMAQAKPPVSDVCSNCRGLGYLTDGTVRTPCPVCKGATKTVPSSAPCKDGACPKPTSR